jgi:hypothetical protein
MKYFLLLLPAGFSAATQVLKKMGATRISKILALVLSAVLDFSYCGH